MRSWPRPALATLAGERLGDAPQLALYDARSRRLEPSRPGAAATLYVCGITPYDATHLGHAATYVAFDLAIRAWRAAGHAVHYVQNVTDVDDPLLERAAATGEDWRELAERETQLFRDDMTALGVLPPDHYVGAVESIPLIVDVIGRLRERGAVYDVDGDLYYSVRSDPSFGEVSGLDRETMLAFFGERGGDPDRPGKRDPLDCLLWRLAREGEPSWETELGAGRPGWHVECTAIALHHLGLAFDVQGGGKDLAFPHHEMSAGHAQAAFPGERFAKSYVHAGMVGYKGEKMSKSLGNLVRVSELRAEGIDPRVIRLALLAHHYRSDWEWTPDQLDAARRRLEGWRAAVRSGGCDATSAMRAVREAMARDLDAPAALAALDAWASDAASHPHHDTPTGPANGSGALVAAVAEESLGITLLDPPVG
ncbi:MAG: L-cysteine:1D-myo-inositol 2-amino-2-deoxy-alpha-D-glucopyranoside ligase [Nocardioidaceae bacterium]|jgi:L-cysteine:1D-myo-inositol 2-amino-2-deoxy-alpha-D-glucopyranoside ligase|nr:L-cysteine:1D-myo-inositol 2-amino-2-deoxy-alpha-D-glucopyranoside ligase [Nocardioidaceae bacterium]